MERVAAVVVTYNRNELLAQCIKALLGQQNAVCDILIVDNASTDGTGAYLAALNEPRVHSRSTGANLGGAGGFNFGMRWAVEAGYDLVWIMDDDTLPHPDSLAQLLAEKGIRVNSVAPGPIWTPLIPSTMPPDQVASFGQQTPMKRAGQPAELAPLYVLLASNEASYISGARVAVTGGTPIL